MSSAARARVAMSQRSLATLATVVAVVGLVGVGTAPPAAAAAVPTFTMGDPVVTEPAGALDPTDTVRTVFRGKISYPGLTSSGDGQVYVTAGPASVCASYANRQVSLLGAGTCIIVPRSTTTPAFQQGAGTPVEVPVAPAKTTVTASSQSVAFGSAPAAVLYTYTAYNELGNPSTARGNLATAPTCTTTATATSLPGLYPATCGGAADPNYTVRAYVPGTVKVAKSPLKVIPPASGHSYYGDPLPVVVPAYSGLLNGDTGPAVPPTCQVFDSAIGPGLASNPFSLPYKGSITYYMGCSGGSDPFYEMSYGYGNDATDRSNWTVTSARLTLTAPSPTVVYGDPLPTLIPTAVGLKNNDTPESLGVTCRVDGARPLTVGTHVVSCPAPTQPNGNYMIFDREGTLTVTPSEAAVTASSQTVAYGTSPAPVTPTYTGLAGDDTAPATAPTCTTTATSTSAPGNYDTVCTGAADPNYSVTSIKGTVTVVPAPLTVTAPSTSITYGAALHHPPRPTAGCRTATPHRPPLPPARPRPRPRPAPASTR